MLYAPHSPYELIGNQFLISISSSRTQGVAFHVWSFRTTARQATSDAGSEGSIAELAADGILRLRVAAGALYSLPVSPQHTL
jgi:hypothetical protein